MANRDPTISLHAEALFHLLRERVCLLTLPPFIAFIISLHPFCLVHLGGECVISASHVLQQLSSLILCLLWGGPRICYVFGVLWLGLPSHLDLDPVHDPLLVGSGT